MNGEQEAETAGFYQATYRDGLRQSTAHCFLNSVENREELTVRTGAFVSHLLFSGKRVSGAEVKREGSTKYQEHAKRGVILCAGAINSPTILLRSGIGPKRELLELGIQAVVDLPGVGKSLHDHPNTVVMYGCSAELSSEQPVSDHVGLFTRSRMGLESAPPDLQLVTFHRSVPPELVSLARASKSAWGILCILGSPKSRGEVRLRKGDLMKNPIINPNYLDREIDRQALIKGLQLCDRIASQKPVANLLTEPLRSPKKIQVTADTASCAAHLTRTLGTTWHPVGTCKMGHDAMAVVDPQLRVYEVDGLYIGDASIMPRIPNANTNAPCIMIGEKLADMIMKSGYT